MYDYPISVQAGLLEVGVLLLKIKRSHSMSNLALVSKGFQ
jgi:hypothetical protein